MNSSTYSATGTALLRIALGVIFIAHGPYLKLGIFGLDGTLGFFQSLGLPAFVAYLTIAGETLGGLALLAGVLVRPAALGLALISFGSITAHAGNGWVFSGAGGGWEYPVFLGITCLVLVLQGAGRFAIGRRGPLN
ncbi:MAG: DoxX family protein [Lysobacteraceae bacterium]